LSFCGLHSQAPPYIHKLDSAGILTKEVKDIIRNNVEENPVVFIGESVHYSGSDFLVKTELVRYLITELGFTDIIFESDFFGLYFDHDKKNLFPHWTRSKQCQKLFEIIEQNGVTIWGFDNQLHSRYSAGHFALQLESFLKRQDIEIDSVFLKLADIVAKNYYRTRKKLTKDQIEYLHTRIDVLLERDEVINDGFWKQSLESFKTALLIYTTHFSLSKGIPIRDAQMAKNLNFMTNKLTGKKVMVWLANAHMSRMNHKFMKGKTMGYQYNCLNPQGSYHIAVGSLSLAPRTKKQMEKSYQDKGNLIHILPSIHENYFIDAKQIRSGYPEISHKVYSDNGIFNMNKPKTDWFQHFDALIFIANGEESVRIENKL
jgi:erythromycin esterase